MLPVQMSKVPKNYRQKKFEFQIFSQQEFEFKKNLCPKIWGKKRFGTKDLRPKRILVEISFVQRNAVYKN